MRATDLVQATIKKESAQQDAEARLYSDTKSAEGLLYKQRQDAEAACESLHLLISRAFIAFLIHTLSCGSHSFFHFGR